MRLPKLRTLLVLVGLCLLGLFVWFAGPFFAFADYHPLEPELVRLIVIAIIVVAWVGSGVLKRVRRMRSATNCSPGSSSRHRTTPAPSAEAIRLQREISGGGGDAGVAPRAQGQPLRSALVCVHWRAGFREDHSAH